MQSREYCPLILCFLRSPQLRAGVWTANEDSIHFYNQLLQTFTKFRTGVKNIICKTLLTLLVIRY